MNLAVEPLPKVLQRQYGPRKDCTASVESIKILFELRKAAHARYGEMGMVVVVVVVVVVV